MKLTTVVAATLAVALETAADPDEIPFEPSPKEQRHCGPPDGIGKNPARPPATWLECLALHAEWSYDGEPGTFCVEARHMLPPSEGEGEGEGGDFDMYVPLVTHGSCTLGVLLDKGSDAEYGVYVGDEDIEALVYVALKDFSSGTEASAYGYVNCDRTEGEGRASLAWSIYDNSDK